MTAPDAPCALELCDVVKRFGRKTALDGCRFGVRSGEIVGVLGPNGAGKSTSLLIATGLMRPDAGEARLDGRAASPAELRAAVAFVPETPEVFPMLSVDEHLLFVEKGLARPDGPRARADALLERFDLARERRTLGAGLSKGMRQKLLVAAAMLRETPVIVLDEPMIGLDPRGQHELRELLAELRGEGRAIVVSTHQLDAAQMLCDAVVFMKRGAVVARTVRGESTAALERLFLDATA